MAKKAKKGFFSQFTVNIINPSKYSTALKSFLRDWLGIDSNTAKNNVLLKQILSTLERIEKIKNEEEVDGIDLGFLNPEDIVDQNERASRNYQQRSANYARILQNGGTHRRRGGAGGGFSSSMLNDMEKEKAKLAKRNELINPAWIEAPFLNDNEVDYLDPRETEFFQKIIDRYLYPLVEDKNYQAKVARDLKALRNNGCFAFFMINALWMVIYFFNLIHTSK